MVEVAFCVEWVCVSVGPGDVLVELTHLTFLMDLVRAVDYVPSYISSGSWLFLSWQC